MRFVVAQTDPARLRGEGPDPRRTGPLPVGVVRWPRDRVTVVVKATYEYEPEPGLQRLKLAETQEPLTALSERSVADLVAFKPAADVVVIGQAYASGPTTRITARVRVGKMDRVFVVFSEGETDRIALTPEAIRDAAGETTDDPVGPCGPFTDVVGANEGEPVVLPPLEADTGEADTEAEDDELTWDDLDDAGDLYRLGGVSFASEEQRVGGVDRGDVIQLEGLCEGGVPLALELPQHEPIVVVETSEGDFWVDPYCDTVLIDTDRHLVTLVWRGQSPHRGPAESAVQRIVVSLERRDEELRPRGKVYRELQRGFFTKAVEPEDLEQDEEPPTLDPQDPELLLAKYETWDLTPEPTLELERYVAVRTALTGGDDRAEVFERHGLDEDAWLLEDQAWSQRILDAVGNDDALIAQYQALVKAAKSGRDR